MKYMVPGICFSAAIACFLFGIYLLYINTYAILNKLSFLFLFAVCILYFAVACSYCAQNETEAILWRRFGSIGVCLFFGFFLHYIIVLAGYELLWKKRWVKYALYTPGIVIAVIFSISNKTTNQIYHMKKAVFGYVNIKIPIFYLILLYVYIFSFMFVGMYFIKRWKKEERGDGYPCKLGIFLGTYIVCAFISVLFAIGRNHSYYYFHELIPLIFLIPIITMCYAVRRYDFMKVEIIKEDQILMEHFRTQITKYISIVYFLGAGTLFFLEYLYREDFNWLRETLFVMLVALIGGLLFWVQKKDKKENRKVVIYSFLLAVSIPLILLHFSNNASITIWAFPFILIIAGLLYNNSNVLLIVSTFAITTQLYLWIFFLNQRVMVDASEYYGRIVMIVIFLIFIVYINRIYIMRMHQLADKIQTQNLLFEISSLISNMRDSNLEEKMGALLERLCLYTRADKIRMEYHYMQEGIEDKKEFHWEQHSFYGKEKMIEVPLVGMDKNIGFLYLLYREERTLPGEETLRVLDVAAKMLGETSVKLSFQRKMEKMAYYDQLTGVPNRQFLGEYMKSALENASKSKEPLAVFFIDIDSFKLINDTLGHHSGDQILKVIAQRVKQELHSNDFICRFGGDEFLILISSQDSYEDYLTFARKLVNSISLPIFSEGQKYTITASLGVSIYPDDGIDYETLIKNADNAMYKAKEKGKNQYVICTEEIKAEVRRKQIITSDLYRALEKRELFLMYQPQISLLDGMQRGMEVLARWKHPIYGMISPDVFIPIAEQTGVIESIGLWIIGEACRQEKEWEVQGLSALRIAVNVSVKQLLYPDFIKHIQELLDKMQMEASHLEFEIAENIAIHETEAIVPILNQIKKMGISIAIDDFGMEYSSLSRIQSLPVNRLKIDMNFIQGITKGEKDQIIIDVIIKLAKRLKIEVIAEGVEKEEEVQFLAEKGCQEAQGYLFCPPLFQDEAMHFLQGNYHYSKLLGEGDSL